jgi:D-tyrosyl-tRNA(Tyr) deacylase
MIALIQRVTRGCVMVDGVTAGAIGAGLVALVCAERTDGEAEADALLAKLLGYRVFEDGDGKMNVSLRDAGGGLLVVPQFTLAADTMSGPPSFTPAASPSADVRCSTTSPSGRKRSTRREAGRFGAHTCR